MGRRPFPSRMPRSPSFFYISQFAFAVRRKYIVLGTLRLEKKGRSLTPLICCDGDVDSTQPPPFESFSPRDVLLLHDRGEECWPGRSGADAHSALPCPDVVFAASAASATNTTNHFFYSWVAHSISLQLSESFIFPSPEPRLHSTLTVSRLFRHFIGDPFSC